MTAHSPRAAFRKRGAVLLIVGSLVNTIADAALSPAHLDLEIELDPQTRRFDARAQLLAPARYTFTLHRTLTVSAAYVAGERVEAHVLDSGETLQRWHIEISRPAPLRIEYGGTLPLLDEALDHRSVLRSRVPMAGTAGSFLPAGSGWYPEPAERFGYRVKLALPGTQRGLVAGRLLSEQLPAGGAARYEAVFRFEQPAEGIDLVAGPWQVREKMMPRANAPPIRLRTYFFHDMDALADDYLTDSARYLALYSDLIGQYPFSEFSVVASPLPTGFGMPAFTYIGARVLKLPFIRATSLGHEVLHNWWGNGVYVDYATGNWSEGLTTFMADYFYRERQSAAAAKEMRLAWLRDFAAVAEDAQRPLSAFRSRTHGTEAALGYGKAAMVFFMLRDEIGEKALRRGIRAFWSTHRFKVASWNDLRIAFEQASGRSLDAFFEQWVQRAGGPKVHIEQARLQDADGKRTLTVTLGQSTPTYALRVPLEWAAGDRGGVHHAAIQNERTAVTFITGEAPHNVRLDPDFRLWRRLDPQVLPPILRQWIIARAARVAVVSDAAEVRGAAQILAKRFFEAPAQTVSARDDPDGRTPLMMIGLHDEVARTLAAWRLPPAPAAVSSRGTARVWTIPGSGSEAPVAVVSGSDADAIAALAQPLPHYGGQSYVVFEGSRVIARGIWPAEVPLTPVIR
jgi:hypothetical protein